MKFVKFSHRFRYLFQGIVFNLQPTQRQLAQFSGKRLNLIPTEVQILQISQLLYFLRDTFNLVIFKVQFLSFDKIQNFRWKLNKFAFLTRLILIFFFDRQFKCTFGYSLGHFIKKLAGKLNGAGSIIFGTHPKR